ncbi:hypothetical protein BHU25_22115 [Pseudomonas vranovensis]|uniref:Uncharacterized protein n=1 Tax=Pseudomonas vranovensis TaxID=321661 RepID=A0A423CZE5_9PSED|nr:hypothetical protein BHU25_22115 [Pseudomonas vranovensis]
MALLVGVVILGMIVAVLFYRYQFDGALAAKSEEWSNFGSYMGGVVGPLVSLVTLFAVLKTVYMQRELLDTQKAEFKELMAKQDEQLIHAKSEANRARVQAYQATLLNVLERFTAEFRYDATEQLAAAEKVTADGRSILESVVAEGNYKQHADDSRKKVAAFTLLALELSVHEFESVEEIQAKFTPQMLKIMYPDEYGDD